MRKKILNPISMFIIGTILGVLSKYLDIYTEDNPDLLPLGHMFSQLPIWVLFGVVISIFSETKKKAMINIFPFCIGMLITYYIIAEMTNSIYGWTFIKGWTVFSFLSPILAYFTWMTKENGKYPKIISTGIVIITVLANIILFGYFTFLNYIIMPIIIYFLFLKKFERT